MSQSHMRLHFLPRLLFSCVFLSNFLIINASLTLGGLVTCRPHQIQALTQFKNEFDSRSCNLTAYFNGVWCDNMTGAITKLQLPSGCLSGPLKPNSSLFRFHQLRYLDLSSNDFFPSPLHAEFGNLNKLEVLSISSNGFVGQVPPTISNLTLLSKLYFDINDLTGSFPLVQNLTKLLALGLSDNNFFGTIPPLLTLPFLSKLDLRRNHFTGSVELPNSSISSRLEYLNLGENHFEAKIIEPISKLINLKVLGLSYLNASYPIKLNLFSSLKSLSTLDFSSNSISPVSLRSDSYIPLDLEELFLENCNIKEFPNILKSFQNLKFIDLGGNGITGKIPVWLWSLPRLSAVYIGNNSLTGFEGSTEILVNSTVQFIALHSNKFEGELPHLPLSINNFLASDNRFKGEIPLSICNRMSLFFLDLSYNNFTGPIPPCLSNLVVVNLRKNNLEGSIPDVFHADAPLQTLEVGFNRLTGKLPRSLLNCSSLKFLVVDNNRLKDTFPFWLKALPNLQVLILRSNVFYGSITPSNQGPLAFPELRIFEISNNNFIGSLPPSYFVNWKASPPTNGYGDLYMKFTQKSGDTTFDYSNAIDLQYKGLSMEQAKVLTSYSAIDFSGNRLEGQIPESIGILKALIALNLSNNAFKGHIPPSLVNLTELESLDLSRNQLSGTIPNGVGSLSFLAYINVSHNKLKGEIPQGTQIIGQNKSCFEGNDRLCGLPLEEICFQTNAPPAQQPKGEDEEEEQVLNWKAVAIAYVPGVVFGLAIAQVIASYKPEWLVKIFGPNKRRAH